jgi:hypothetical protein
VNPLPIELTTFQGEATNTGNMITWTTVSETNNDHFELERGINAYTFEKIMDIEGAGNSTAALNYHYLDANHVPGINYYRLKQVDYNGEYSYSSIISIDNTGSENTFIMAYPNPTTESFVHLKFSDNIKAISIYNVIGEEVFHSSDLSSDTNMMVNILAKGIYILKAVSADNKLISTKFTKQ